MVKRLSKPMDLFPRSSMFEVLWKSWWAQHTDLFRSAQTMTVCELWTQVTATHCQAVQSHEVQTTQLHTIRLLYGPRTYRFLFICSVSYLIFYYYFCVVKRSTFKHLLLKIPRFKAHPQDVRVCMAKKGSWWKQCHLLWSCFLANLNEYRGERGWWVQLGVKIS